jgi:hypothetical protein
MIRLLVCTLAAIDQLAQSSRMTASSGPSTSVR